MEVHVNPPAELWKNSVDPKDWSDVVVPAEPWMQGLRIELDKEIMMTTHTEKSRLMVAFCLAMLLVQSGFCGSDRMVWHDKPAKTWQSEAFPLGNGRMGCMVFGGINEERIQFNVDIAWRDGKLVAAEIRASVKSEQTVGYGKKRVVLKTAPGGSCQFEVSSREY